MAALAFFALCRSAKAEPFDLNATDWQGGSELFDLARKRFGRDRIEIVATLDYERLTPRDGLVILHPEVELDYAELSAFLRAGGRVAVLDDHGTADRFLARFQIRRVKAPANPARSLRGNAELAIADPAVQLVAGQEQNRHPITQNVDQVVTNHPTALLHPNLTPVLTIAARGEPDATLAVTGIIVNRGRLFAMGDPSAVINLMLRYPGNRRFAEGLLNYLVEPDSWGERGGKIYFVANRFQQRGQYGGPASALDGIRRSVTEALVELHQNGLPPPLPLVFSVLAALTALGWALLNATRPHRRATPRYATPEPLAAQGGIAGRGAVLSAPTTDAALALSELRAAILDVLGDRLGLGRAPSAQAALNEVARRALLSPERYRDLETGLSELRAVEEGIPRRKRAKMSPGELSRLRKKVMAAVREIDDRSGS